MAAINSRLRSLEGCHFAFWCPGCKDHHAVGMTWAFDGNFERPTVQPSLLVRSGHFTDRWKEGDECWCTYKKKHPSERHPFSCYRCHIFITKGEIQFLDDCTHELAGKTVPIPDWPTSKRRKG